MLQKLFNAKQIKQIDSQTIKIQNISSEQLMERAATVLFHQLKPLLSKDNSIYIFCGKGNNGGDGLVLARLLYLNDYTVKCFAVPFSPKASPDYEINLNKLKRYNFSVEKFNPENPPSIHPDDVIIDAIFGTGLSRPAEGIAGETIAFINKTGAKVYSVDVPSGLYVDTSNRPGDRIVKVHKVFTFQFPKISFFYPENYLYVPDFQVLDIGLEQQVMDSMPVEHFMITPGVKRMLKKRNPTAHKYRFGSALIIGGSKGMTGAPVMAGKAALRVGAGLVANCIPEAGYTISQTYVPEVISYTCGKNYLKRIVQKRKFDAIGIGMGLGTHKATQKAFKQFIKTNKQACVIDADALNILSKHPKWLRYLNNNYILTPHTGEFKRLAGDWKNDHSKLLKLRELAQKNQAIVVLKGAYTTISDGKFYYINPIANPALATAGSGDVLTGIITGLLAQAYQPLEAALLGVYIHSAVAQNYVKKHPDYSMIATDIIEGLKMSI